MERNQLKYVVEVARWGNITRAAEALHIAQPSLSNQILHLERELGVPLFERRRKRVYLTDAGSAFVKKAEQILGEIDYLKETMDEYAHLRMGRIRIGALSTMVPLGIPYLISDFQKQYPDIEITITEDGSLELIQQIKSNTLDAAFIIHYEECEDEELINLELMNSRLMAIVNKDNPLAARASLKLEDLRNQRLIVNSDHFNLRHMLFTSMEQYGIPYKVAAFCNQIETCYVLADQGLGIGFCTEANIGHYHCSNVVYLPMEELPRCSVYLVYKQNPDYHPVLKSFVKFICGYYPGE